MTTDDARKLCEQENGTTHLPQTVRDAIWHVAYEHHHSCGMGDVVNMYDEYANPAILAFKAGEDKVRAEEAVTGLVRNGLKMLIFNAGVGSERKRIVEALRKWADGMDAPEWRNGWTQEIVAARSFALQIEEGTL